MEGLGPEERLYRALGDETLERVPTLSVLVDTNIANQVLGRKPDPSLRLLRSRTGGALVERFPSLVTRGYLLTAPLAAGRLVRANHLLGFDGVGVIFWPGKILNRSEAEDLFGRKFELTDDGFGNIYMMYKEGLISGPEGWRKYPWPDPGRYAEWHARAYRRLRKRWNDRIAVVPFVGPGPWEQSWQPMGFTQFVSLMRKDPAFAREVAGRFIDLTVTVIDAYCSAGARVVLTGDDLAYKSGPMLSPDIIEEYYGEGYRRMAGAAHRHGARIIFHCCGRTDDLLEKFIAWGYDGAHAFEPPAGNDLARARSITRDRICMVGNIDITRTLVDATREEVRDEVRRAVKDSVGRLILAPAHGHPAVNARNVRWMIEAALDTGTDPSG
jgi:uroporphyrinogen decarboxylase